MYEKEKKLAKSYIDGKVSRRSMLRGMASMGVTPPQRPGFWLTPPQLRLSLRMVLTGRSTRARP